MLKNLYKDKYEDLIQLSSNEMLTQIPNCGRPKGKKDSKPRPKFNNEIYNFQTKQWETYPKKRSLTSKLSKKEYRDENNENKIRYVRIN